MIEHLIEEIGICLKDNCQIAALTMALTLPDTCGKACYPESRNKDRYVRWCDSYLNVPQKNAFGTDSVISSEELYKLRCALLHESNPMIHGTDKKITKFSLIWHSASSCSRTSIERYGILDEKGECQEQSLSIDIVSLCKNICDAAGMYYQENKEKFFFDYRIISTSDHVANCFMFNNEMEI